MAGNCPNTRPGTEEPAYFRHSPVSGHFSRFIAALGAEIEAERDIEEVFWSDPAFDRWLSVAELAWNALLSYAAWRSATQLADTGHKTLSMVKKYTAHANQKAASRGAQMAREQSKDKTSKC